MIPRLPNNQHASILQAAQRKVKKPVKRFAAPQPSPTPRVSGMRRQQSY